MDILIKDMEKPKNAILEEHLSDGRVIKHEAIEIPPHGRLVDADSLIEKLQNRIREIEAQAERGGWKDGRVEASYSTLRSALVLLEHAQTIIEAST